MDFIGCVTRKLQFGRKINLFSRLPGLNITDTVNVVARNCKTTAAMQFSCAITCKMGGFIIYISYDRQALSLIGNN